MEESKRIRLAVLQRVCPNYRVALFSQLTNLKEHDVKLFIGDDIPNSKVKSGGNLGHVKFTKLKTKFLKIGSHVFPWHKNLISELRKFKPDVILCEAESHFLGYLSAIAYKKFFNRNVALMYWCYIDLPGKTENPRQLSSKIKRYFRKYFEAFVLYSSYGKTTLLNQGFKDDQIFPTTNVGDVDHFLHLSDTLPDTIEEAKEKVQLPNEFTVLYVGTLDANKRPDMMLELASKLSHLKVNFVLLGAGDLLEPLRLRVAKEKLSNVFLPGRVTGDLALYYRAANVMLIPGRGGIIISEAMAFGLPVIVHEADGTEFDLIKNDKTGKILKSNGVDDFAIAIEDMILNKDKTLMMGNEGKKLIQSTYTTKSMIKSIVSAALYSYSKVKKTTL